MAKSGDVTAAGTSEPIKSAVMGDLTPELTLGQIAAATLNGSSDPLVVVIDLDARTVKAYAEASSAEVSAGDATGTFTSEDETKKVATWLGVGVEAALANTASKPARSLASLISVIEDKIAADNLSDSSIVVDQVEGKVYLFAGNAFDAFGTPQTALATLTQTITESDGTIKNAFE